MGKTRFSATKPPRSPTEDLSVKSIQAGLLAHGSFYSLPLPILQPLRNLKALRTVDPASFVPDHSGVAVPDSHGVPHKVQIA
jgi:hypothetical protein